MYQIPGEVLTPDFEGIRTGQFSRKDIARRTAEGLTKREAMRCLKRFVARELYRYLSHDPRAERFGPRCGIMDP